MIKDGADMGNWGLGDHLKHEKTEPILSLRILSSFLLKRSMLMEKEGREEEYLMRVRRRQSEF